MKKIKLLGFVATMSLLCLTGCQTQADKVSYNLSQEADSFNVIRRLTAINCIEGDVIFQMTGKISIEVDETEKQLEIIVENEDGDYAKHFVGLSDNVTYTVEDLGASDVNNYKYTLNFNPKMWLPEVDTIE